MNKIEESLISLMEKFNETGEIDVDEFVKAVLEDRLKFNHVYYSTYTGDLHDAGVLQDRTITYCSDEVTETIVASRFVK